MPSLYSLSVAGDVLSAVRSEFLRFLLVGGLNTALSYSIYWTLLILLPYLLAYSAAYACGIIISYFLNAVYVFRKRPNIKDFIKFPAVYVFQYIFGVVLLGVLVSSGTASKEAGMFFVILINVPLTFLLTRVLMLGKVQNEAKNQ